jgi:type VI secretion system protein ImpA
MPLRDDLLTPIPGDNPAGVNLRYDPVTDRIKEARREDIDAPQGDWKTALKAADHNAAIKLAGEALAKRGKDLQLAVWLVDSHIRKEGFVVLASGFRFLHNLLEQYWDNLYPLVEDDDSEMRAAPLAWLGSKMAEPLGFLPIVNNKLSWLAYKESRLVGYQADADTGDKQMAREARLNEGKISAEEFDEAVGACSVSSLKDTLEMLNEGLSEAETLSEYCDVKFGGFSPSFLPVRNAIEEIAQTVKILIGKKAPEGVELPDAEFQLDVKAARQREDETAAEPELPSDSSEESDSFSTPEPSFSGEISSLDDATRQLASICKFLREQDSEDPSPYLILRSYAWGKLLAHSPLIDNSALEAPPSEWRVGLKRATADGDWDQVLAATEEAVAQPGGRVWLDLQRYTVNALEQKGSPAAARVVRDALRGFLEGLPVILDLTLPDDTPAANADTRSWIANFVLRQHGPPMQAPNTSAEEAPAEESFTFDDAPADTSFDPLSSSDSSEPTPEPGSFAVEVDQEPPIIGANDAPPSDTSDEFQVALAAVKEGRTVDGLSVIASLMATERSGRARFRRRTQLAHLLLAAGQPKVAQPLLDHIATEIEDRHLEDWEESEALAYPLHLLLRCLSPSEEERRTQLYGRICKLDPVRALNWPL